MLRIFLADGRESARRAIESYLSQYCAEWKVIGEAKDGSELLRKVTILQPDVVILEGNLPDSPILSVISILKTRYPGLSILVLGANRKAALAAGAHAFVHQGDSPERLLTALRVIQCEQADE
jgi:DNA-binding NarL/FixJ family response regulator